MRKRWYIGRTKSRRELFSSESVPTVDSHGARYNAVIGPFRTRAGAVYMFMYGENNPHCRTVAQAERLAKKFSVD